jgi:UDP-glucuronate 4-epimerase
VNILLTGAAGFIGMSTALRLLSRGDEVLGVDNLNPYYDVQLKLDRLQRLQAQPGFRFAKVDIADRPAMAELFADERFDRVSISRHRRAFATRCRTRMPTSTATSWAS